MIRLEQNPEQFVKRWDYRQREKFSFKSEKKNVCQNLKLLNDPIGADV